jgi:uncharacterized RDD family membrane protein YckC
LAGPAPRAGAETVQSYRGERIGLPESGVGSIASLARRFGAFFVDVVIAGLIASIFVQADVRDVAAMQVQNYWGVVIWFGITAVAVSFFGFTPGMGLFGIRVVRLDGSSMVGPFRAIPRTLLIVVLIPVVIWDRDYRGLHDKLAKTAVVNIR